MLFRMQYSGSQEVIKTRESTYICNFHSILPPRNNKRYVLRSRTRFYPSTLPCPSVFQLTFHRFHIDISGRRRRIPFRYFVTQSAELDIGEPVPKNVVYHLLQAQIGKKTCPVVMNVCKLMSSHK